MAATLSEWLIYQSEKLQVMLDMAGMGNVIKV